MRKVLIGLSVLACLSLGAAFATPLPDNVQNFVKASFLQD